MPLKLKLRQVGRIDESISELYIVNDGTGTPEVGNYVAIMSDTNGRSRRIQFNGHRRGLGAWVLVHKILGRMIEIEEVEMEKYIMEQLERETKV